MDTTGNLQQMDHKGAFVTLLNMVTVATRKGGGMPE